MPKKSSLSFLGKESTPTIKAKLPTLRQYVKELPKDVENIISTVHIIWLPGQWNNITLQTHDFRVIIPEEHEFYLELRDNIDEITKDNQTLVVTVTNTKSLSFRLDVSNSVPGEWFYIGGNAGIRFDTELANTDDEY